MTGQTSARISGQRKWSKRVLWAGAALIVFPFAWWGVVQWWYGSQLHTAATAPPQRVAIVFGARVYANGRLSAMLRDRVETAVQLYHAGIVQKILVSGDNSSLEYNEPQEMMAYAIARGVPAADIQPDYGGRRTYDTCYRARAIFQVESALLVTQAFHLPRALFTCRVLGMPAEGVIADQRNYSDRSLRWSTTREIPATLVALWDVVWQRPAAVLGAPIPIE